MVNGVDYKATDEDDDNGVGATDDDVDEDGNCDGATDDDGDGDGNCATVNDDDNDDNGDDSDGAAAEDHCELARGMMVATRRRRRRRRRLQILWQYT